MFDLNLPSNIEELPSLDDIIADANESGGIQRYEAMIRFHYLNATDAGIKDKLKSMLDYLEKPSESTSTPELLQFMATQDHLKRLWVISDGLKEEIQRDENLHKAEAYPETVQNRVEIIQRKKGGS